MTDWIKSYEKVHRFFPRSERNLWWRSNYKEVEKHNGFDICDENFHIVFYLAKDFFSVSIEKMKTTQTDFSPFFNFSSVFIGKKTTTTISLNEDFRIHQLPSKILYIVIQAAVLPISVIY